MIAFSPAADWAGRAGSGRLRASWTPAVARSCGRTTRGCVRACGFGRSAAISGDGKFIASSRGEKGVELWEAASGDTVLHFEVPEQKQEWFSPDGKLTRSVDLALYPDIGPFSPDGDLLAVESGHQLLLFDVKTGKPHLSIPLHSIDGGSLPAKIPPHRTDEDMAAMAWLSHTIILVDLRTGKEIRRFESSGRHDRLRRPSLPTAAARFLHGRLGLQWIRDHRIRPRGPHGPALGRRRPAVARHQGSHAGRAIRRLCSGRPQLIVGRRGQDDPHVGGRNRKATGTADHE